MAEHREIEAELDRLGASLRAGAADLDSFRRAWTLCRAHYPAEEEHLAAVHPEAARKLARQHAEALEIAEHVESAGADQMQLLRRFAAIAQHNIIEEERDVFPLDR